MPIRALVTGGSGFIGSHLVDALVLEGSTVRVLDNLANSTPRNLAAAAAHIEFIEGDIRDESACRDAVRGCEVVFHLAALGSVPRSLDDPVTTNAVNIGGTLNVLNAARAAGVRRLVYASSSSVYGNSNEPTKREDMPTAPRSPYAVSKLGGELYCRAFGHSFGLDTVCLRFFNVFGPRQRSDSPYAAVVPRFIAGLLGATPVTVHGDGMQTRDFTYVDNVVDATILAAESPSAAGETVNVACGERATVNTLLDVLGRISGLTYTVDEQPPRPGDVRHAWSDIDRARSLLGYAPAVLLDEGLRRTWEWTLRQQGSR